MIEVLRRLWRRILGYFGVEPKGLGDDARIAQVVARSVVLRSDTLLNLARQGDAYSLESMLQWGEFDVNVRDPNNGRTALHYAAALGARPCIRVLVKCGKCDYALKDDTGRTAADLAIQLARDYAVARLLTTKHLGQMR